MNNKKFPPRVWLMDDSVDELAEGDSIADAQSEKIRHNDHEYLSLCEHQAITAKLVEEAYENAAKECEDWTMRLLDGLEVPGKAWAKRIREIARQALKEFKGEE